MVDGLEPVDGSYPPDDSDGKRTQIPCQGAGPHSNGTFLWTFEENTVMGWVPYLSNREWPYCLDCIKAHYTNNKSWRPTIVSD